MSTNFDIKTLEDLLEKNNIFFRDYLCQNYLVIFQQYVYLEFLKVYIIAFEGSIWSLEQQVLIFFMLE